ncbi:hypothetical protein HPP92_023252 [Vanilla planifolia]|uniref:DUF629 domain-containing protein n=1 Tax=Vanilla planifolia TaxID=51239 RepID=A0A835PZ13_VANPL|nr:hypothetical protein HPP92_023555 [Vanilla planifolia]KAG0460124.1 hypothetical protein HPP92_023252 [Vanilla planifolia]
MREHMGSLTPKLQSILPHEVDREWIEMLVNGCWKPIDSISAIKMLEDEANKGNLVVKDKCSDTVDCKGRESISEDLCLENSESSSSPQRMMTLNVENGHAFASQDNQSSEFFEDAFRRWPLSGDLERVKLLEKIQGLFRLFIKHKSLSVGHLNKVIQFALEEIHSLPSGLLLLNNAVDQSPICICLLGGPQLRKVLKFLQDLSQSCGLGRYSEKDFAAGVTEKVDHGGEVLEGISLASDTASLLLDGRLFLPKNGSRNADVSSVGDVTGSVPDADAMISWLFLGPSREERIICLEL